MAGAKKGAGHKSCMSVVQIPADRKNTELSYVVHAVKIRGAKSPETLDTVGVQPTVSKAFRCFGRPEHFRRHGVNRCSPMGCGFSVFLESLCYLPLITRELIDFLANVPSFQCEYHQNNKLISPNRRSLEKMTL